MSIAHLGKGAVNRPDHLKLKDRLGAPAPFDWSQIQEDTVGNVSGLFGIADQDQGSSGTCTVQTTRYGFKYTIKVDLSVEDIYSHIFLSGGGAYLNAPLDYARKNGVAPQALYPDPNPQTEANMERTITVKDGDRIRTFVLSYTYYPDNTIDAAAYAATQHDYIHIGLYGSNAGWANPLEPVWDGHEEWGHALFASRDSICLHHGLPTIKARSSWCSEKIYCHYLTKNYFPAVFELIGVDIKEIQPYMLVFFQVKNTPTIWSLIEGQWVGFSDITAFNAYVGGRPNVVLELDQAEFAKLTTNPEVFKS